MPELERSKAFKILSLSENSTYRDVQKRYCAIALKLHPDRNKNPDAEEKFKPINEAKERLGQNEEDFAAIKERDSINKSSEKGNEKKYSGSVNKRRRSNSTAPNPFDIVSFSYQGLNLIEKLKTFRYSAQDSVMNGYIRGAQSNYEGLIYNGSLEQKQAFINELNGTVAALEQEHTQQKSIKQFSDKLKNTRVPELVNEAHRIGKAITQKLPQDRAQVIN